MKLSRKWLNEFVDLAAVGDREFAEAMTLSGSKVEVTEVLNESLKNVVAGRVLSMERHPDSDHMWVCQIDVGQDTPTQIVTGAWNVHVGDMVPAALHKSLLPGGKKIEKGKLRGVVSNGMLCSLKELELTADHDYPESVIVPAALLNDYKPLDAAKPSIPADVQPGHHIYGKVAAARVMGIDRSEGGLWACALDTGSGMVAASTACANLHEGDMVAYDSGKNHICTLEDLHAQQAEFPHCIPDGIWILPMPCAPGDDVAALIGADDHVVEFEITPNRPDCLSVIGLAREAMPPVHRETCEKREDSSLSGVDAPAAARLRRPAHQQHRGHHQLCHAGVRPAHARLRLLLRGRGTHHRPPRPGGRDHPDPGRQRAQADAQHAVHLR